MLIVGERINSTTRKIARAIERKDAGYIQKEAKAQVDAGAQMIDVNAGTFISDEPERLTWLVQTVQQAVDIPLCIDSMNPVAIAAALEVHKGKAMVNSITAESVRFANVVPLVKQYGSSVVALCLGNMGVPGTAQERFEIASDLIQRLSSEGIARDDIYLDPVVMPLSINVGATKDVLDAIERIAQSFEAIHIVCGISNVSFGLPVRRQLNRLFLAMAVARGLDAAILDPCDARAMANLVITRTLLGKDEYCRDYIRAYTEGRLKTP